MMRKAAFYSAKGNLLQHGRHNVAANNDTASGVSE